MDGQERLRVLLELDRGAGDVLSGRIAMGDELHEFSGWLSLIAVIEDARRHNGTVGRSPPSATVGQPLETRTRPDSGPRSVNPEKQKTHHSSRPDGRTRSRDTY